MAEGNLCVVANRILEMLRREDIKKMGSLWRVPQELLREPEDTILTLAPLLIDVEKRSLHYHNEALKEWLRQLGKTLYDADNLLDDFNTAALRRRSMSSSRRLKMAQVTKTVRRFFSTSSNPAVPTDRFKVLDHLTKIKGALDSFASDLPKFRLEESSGTSTDDDGEFQAVPVPVPGERESSTEPTSVVKEEKADERESSTEPSSVVKEEKAGERAYDREAVVKLLLVQEFQENVSVLPIIGMEGPGKTTLARDVFDDERVRKHFSELIWVSVSDDLDLKKFLKQVVVCATSRSVEFLDIGSLEHLLRELLRGKRYLIVLDDVWNQDSAKWDQLKHVLQFVAGASGSAVILTSCCEKVARISGSIEPYCLYHLSHEQSWNLFQRIAFGERDSQECRRSEMLSIGRQIVRQCGSHPFLISAIGGMLYFKKTEAEWRFFYEKEFFRMENTDHKRQLLKLCYDDLPSPLKHCFAFCSLFPKDHEIDVQTLVKLWMAHGFIHPQSSHQSFEDVGYGYFLNLLRRSFFHEVVMDVKGRVTKCKMHDLMHDLATDVAGEQCLLLDSQTGSGYPHRRASHVSFAFNLLPSVGQVLASLIFVGKLQSILFLTRTEDKIFDTIISRCRLLRVLDMHALGIKKVPYSIVNLYHLRYLDLSENEDITELPNSITELLHLQTLRLSSCFNLRKLPRHIGNLINLRHLEIDGCYNLLSLPRGIARLTNLQTLSQIVLSEDASMRRDQLKQLGRLKNFRGEFEIKNLKHGKDEIGAYLSEKWGVRSLSLEWENRAPKLDEDGKPLDTLLFSDLEELALNGFRGATLFQPSFPGNLVKLSLRRWIKGKHLPPLHQCIKLKVLVLAEITNLEFVENEPVSLSMTFFPSLRELWLIKLPELQGWSKTSSMENQELPSFPRLSKLVIEDCPKLASMPLFPTLEEGLVLESTCLNSFQLTMKHKLATATAADEASSSSNAPSSPLSKLKNLCIVGIDKFDDSKADEISWDNLQSLKLLELDNLPELKTLPEGLKHVSSLRELHVWRSGVTEIPAWIGELKSLEKLVIRVCPKLKSLPEIKDWRLKTLEIEGCPTLIRRCEEGIGADWEKVKHIDLRLGR